MLPPFIKLGLSVGTSTQRLDGGPFFVQRASNTSGGWRMAIRLNLLASRAGIKVAVGQPKVGIGLNLEFSFRKYLLSLSLVRVCSCLR